MLSWINDALYSSMLKHESKKVFAYSAGLILYEGLITWVYSILCESPLIEDLPQSFPEPIRRAFGVATEKTDTSYEAYISAQFLTRMWPLLISFYGIGTADALVTRLAEQGFLAYPLSAPVSRAEVFNTQIFVLLSELGLITGATIGGIYAAAAWFELKIPRLKYLSLGISGFVLAAFISAYSLLLGVLLPEEEQPARLAGGLTVVFYGLDIISGLSERFSGLRPLTPFGWFRPLGILQGKVLSVKPCLGMSALSGAFYILANRLFICKDLEI